VHCSARERGRKRGSLACQPKRHEPHRRTLPWALAVSANRQASLRASCTSRISRIDLDDCVTPHLAIAFDAAEATLAVVTRLAGHPQALVFVVSHIGEVVPSIADDHRIRLLQFSAEMNGDEPRFDYRVRDGVSTQRLGMTLRRREQVLELLEVPKEGHC
jgi:hypothetical protein